MDELNEHIFDSTISLNLDLIRLDKNTQKEVIVILKKMERELIALLSIDDLTAFNKARLKQQLAEAKFVINQYYDEMAAANLAATSGVPLITATQTAGALSVATGDLVKGVGILPTTAYMESLAGNAIIQGAVQKDWWKRQSADMTWRFNSAVRQGLVGSETNQQIVKRVRESIDISTRNATTLVRTSVMTVANESRQNTYEAHSDVIKSLIWSSAIDSRVCVECASRDNREWDLLTKKPINHSIPFSTPPKHMNCLTGDSLVTTSSSIVGASKRWMDGNVIVIKTSTGRELTCTPHHPILTNAGWIFADSLNVGDNVVANRVSNGARSSGRNDKDVPATIHNITESFFSSSKMDTRPVPVAAKDFHSDGADSKVGIVSTNRFLRNKINPTICKHCGDQILMDGLLSKKSSFSSFCPEFFGFLARNSTSTSIMGWLGKQVPFFWGKSSHPSVLLLRLISKINTSFFKTSSDDTASATDSISNSRNTDSRLKHRNSNTHINIDDFTLSVDTSSIESSDNRLDTDIEAIRDVLATNAGCMFFDNIVNIEVKSFHGYVYNIETEKGWYTANGIVTHNCRCSLLPKLKTFRDLGVDINEVPKGKRASMNGFIDDISFKSFMDRKGDKFMDNILGKGRAKLYREKKITFDQLLDSQGNEINLKDLTEKYVK